MDHQAAHHDVVRAVRRVEGFGDPLQGAVRRGGVRRRARAMTSREGSTPRTVPRKVSASAITRVKAPVPHPTSRTRSPGRAPLRAASWVKTRRRRPPKVGRLAKIALVEARRDVRFDRPIRDEPRWLVRHPSATSPSTSRSRSVRAAADLLRPRAPSPVHHAARARRSASAMMASPHRIARVPQTGPSLLGYGKPLPWKLRNAIDDAP